MRVILHISILLFSLTIASQEINTKLINEFKLNADNFIGIDDFENIYFIKNNTLFKKSNGQLLSYSNTQLGNITSIDITNPLKILIFYKDFNTILLLDNNLNTLTKPINFTLENVSQNISLVVNAPNNNIWLFSQDDTRLSLWNYQTRKVKFTTQPLALNFKNFKANFLISNYKTVWISSNDIVIKLNEFGVILNSFTIEGINNFFYFNNNIIYQKNNKLYLSKNENEAELIKLNKEITIKKFYITKNDIYIFDGTKIYVFSFLKI